MSDNKGDEKGAYDKGRNGGIDLDPFKTESEEAAKERGQEDRENAKATREENEEADDAEDSED